MLVLSRRPKESLVIIDSAGNEIRVTVNEVNGSKVRLGIEAPKEVRILRTEVAQQLARAGILPKWKSSKREGLFAASRN